MPESPVSVPSEWLGRYLTLRSDVSAMQILPFSGDELRLSPVSRLPIGASIEACGRGFDDTTLKVAYGGQFYFVFAKEIGAAL